VIGRISRAGASTAPFASTSVAMSTDVGGAQLGKIDPSSGHVQGGTQASRRRRPRPFCVQFTATRGSVTVVETVKFTVSPCRGID
jgi:hypothetical protein